MTSSSAPQSPLTKRCSDTKESRRERREGRIDTLLEKVFEFSTRCGAEVRVSIRMKDTGRIVIPNSDIMGSLSSPDSSARERTDPVLSDKECKVLASTRPIGFPCVYKYQLDTLVE
jgi:hypothetical protein